MSGWQAERATGDPARRVRSRYKRPPSHRHGPVQLPRPRVTSEYRPHGAWLPVPQTPRYAARPSRLLGPLVLATVALLVAGALVTTPLLVAAGVTAILAVILLGRWRAVAAEVRRLNAEVALRPGRHARDVEAVAPTQGHHQRK